MRQAYELVRDLENCDEQDCQTCVRFAKTITAARLEVVARLREMADGQESTGRQMLACGVVSEAGEFFTRASNFRTAVDRLEREIHEAVA